MRHRLLEVPRIAPKGTPRNKGLHRLRSWSALTVLSVVAATSATRQLSPILFCDLVRDPAKYNGRTVEVRATYRYGFEWHEFYCLDCLDKGKAWLELPDDMDDASLKELKRAPKGAGIVNVTVRGVFLSRGREGRLELIASSVTQVVTLSKGMHNRAEEERVERHRACGGANPR